MGDDLVCPRCKTDHGKGIPPGPPSLELLGCKCGWVKEPRDWLGFKEDNEKSELRN